MKITKDFEERLRKAEEDLHIRSDNRVNVRYVQSEYVFNLKETRKIICSHYKFTFDTYNTYNLNNCKFYI